MQKTYLVLYAICTVKKKDFNINLEDEIINKTLIKRSLIMEIDPFIFRLAYLYYQFL